MKLLRISTTLVFIKKKFDKHDLHIDKLYRGKYFEGVWEYDSGCFLKYFLFSNASK
jgi:hypothetical protein